MPRNKHKKPVMKKNATTTKTRKPQKAKAQAPKAKKKRRMSALDAAAKVLTEAKQPMTCGEMVKEMLDRGLWQTGGKTPAATLYSAIIRHIARKGDDARFEKVERGKFTLAK